jgi:hypothetical protein
MSDTCWNKKTVKNRGTAKDVSGSSVEKEAAGALQFRHVLSSKLVCGSAAPQAQRSGERRSLSEPLRHECLPLLLPQSLAASGKLLHLTRVLLLSTSHSLLLPNNPRIPLQDINNWEPRRIKGLFRSTSAIVIMPGPCHRLDQFHRAT